MTPDDGSRATCQTATRESLPDTSAQQCACCCSRPAARGSERPLRQGPAMRQSALGGYAVVSVGSATAVRVVAVDVAVAVGVVVGGGDGLLGSVQVE